MECQANTTDGGGGDYLFEIAVIFSICTAIFFTPGSLWREGRREGGKEVGRMGWKEEPKTK